MKSIKNYANVLFAFIPVALMYFCALLFVGANAVSVTLFAYAASAILIANTVIYSYLGSSHRQNRILYVFLNLFTVSVIKHIFIVAAAGTGAWFFYGNADLAAAIVFFAYYAAGFAATFVKKEKGTDYTSYLKEAALYMIYLAFVGHYVWAIAAAAFIFFYAASIGAKKSLITSAVIFVLTTALYVVFSTASYNIYPDSLKSLKLTFFILFLAVLIAWFVHSLLVYKDFTSGDSLAKKTNLKYLIVSASPFLLLWYYIFSDITGISTGTDSSVYFFMKIRTDAPPVLLALITGALTLSLIAFTLYITVIAYIDKKADTVSDDKKTQAEPEEPSDGFVPFDISAALPDAFKNEGIPISVPYDINFLKEKIARQPVSNDNEDEESKKIDDILNKINRDVNK
ncbi:MAG: hypothetical protein LBT30_08550 [Clostridiales bacterium]|jgi:hypothetical protein|nr:hypothetical protein [Clostridiales bacterium]